MALYPKILFGKKVRSAKSWGLVYNSIRHTNGTCIAIFRLPAITIPKINTHFRYVWNGEKIISIFEILTVPISVIAARDIFPA